MMDGYRAIRFASTQGGLYVPAVAGHYASTPDEAGVDITGDIDVRVHHRRISAEKRALAAKYETSGNQRSWAFRYATGNGDRLEMVLSSDGAAVEVEASSADIPFSVGEDYWARVTVDVSAGDVDFYTSADGGTWTKLGSTQSTSVGSLMNSSSPLEVGSIIGGTDQNLGSVVHEARLYDGIDGTLVANPVFEHPVTKWGVAGATMHDGERVWTLHGDQLEWRA